MSGWRDGARLAAGTLTVLPVRPPSQVDRQVATRAVLLFPAVGLGLGATAAMVLEGTRWAVRGQGALQELLAAVLAVAVLAWLTRALHLDGLADTADGLGSGREAAAALTVMRRGDLGPFGVVAVVLTLLVQVAALATCVAAGQTWLAAVVAVVTGRLALLWGCRAGVPVARPGGLGATVLGSVPRGVVTAALVAWTAGLAGLSLLDDDASPWRAGHVGVAVAVGLAVAWSVQRRAMGRLGGTTGDVLGAMAELATAATLVALAFG